MPLKHRTLRTVLSALIGLTAIQLGLVAQSPPPATRPRLVVIISIDQMRADYIDRFQHQWTKGLKRLVDRGAWFSQAAYPYQNTVTCVGHATIGTGSVPAIHGMILNEWWDRETGKEVACTSDSSVSPVSYGAPLKRGHSAARLQVPTLADEMRVQLSPSAHVVSMSLKARSAIMLAGHRGDAVTWFDDNTGSWSTSSAYSTSPVPFLAKFFADHPVTADFGKTWNLAMTSDRYLYDDSTAGRTPPKGWGPSLPHELRGEAGKPDPDFFEQWSASPYSNDYLARMALASVEALGLGASDRADFLGLSFSALDHAGHDFGPMSHEVQDVLVRLDETLGAFFDALDARIGADHYVVAVSADHGVSPIPEQAKALGLDAGRIDTKALRDRLEEYLVGRFGAGKYIAYFDHLDLYFTPGTYRRVSTDPEALTEVMRMIRSHPGVLQVYRAEDLAALSGSTDPAETAAALSYYPGRSGDLVLASKPYWIATDDSAATHGTSNGYDARVPVIFMGAGIRSGRYLEPASPADIAPTLASMVGVTLARPSGRVLAEAVQGSEFKVRIPRTKN